MEISKDGLMAGLLLFAVIGFIALFADGHKTDLPITPPTETEQISSITPDIVESELPQDSDLQIPSDTQPIESFEPLAETGANTPVSPAEQLEYREIFYKWTESEKQLRDAYTKLLNDPDVSQSELDSRKTEYLIFVDNKNKKCGNLDNKHSGNINSDVSDVKFNKEETVILNCHQVENSSELMAFEKDE